MSEKRSILKDKSFAFAVRVAKLYKHLSESKKEFVLSKQLLRSGTSIGANIREANNAESSADFIHKLAIAQKETDETLYWLELLFSIELLTKKEYDSLYSDANELLKIIRSSILTVKKRRSNL
ncbi:MAG: four helix bundle protein [Chitinophagaceae bacterium]|nr:four helix bundle protein [Chitinophagaceae bacterium]